ncbi:hypothetical protein [Pseudomonas segetis]|uniref:Uncharacterized protein n=1 Tax=Pseudomonas segetis TaxID=298908 RepID=A0A239CEU2_9PSED|nr:hypothetical protein [Pseudomonas segetis]SNS17863.1 hypothetical protein SAMN05216255_1631 [Pseudomonas segetis]
MSRYEVVFSGQLVPGADLALVQANLGRLFQANPQRIAMMFSGRRLVIKNNLDQANAEKYRTTLERAGAVVDIVVMPDEIEEIELAPAPAATEPAPAAPATVSAQSSKKLLPRDEYMAAFSEVQAPDFGIAPLGDDLQDGKPEPQAPNLDLSQFSLAPVGSDMGQAKDAPPGPAPDVSHLKLQD